MGSRKPFWRISGHHRSPSSSSDTSPTPSLTPAAMPVEFLCPISRTLMADPVIVPPAGHTFERSCIQACVDLAFSPPGLALDLNPATLLLIPNVALKSAIVGWCERSGIPPPQPIPPEAAHAFVRRLLPPAPANRQPRAVRDQRGEFVGQFAEFSLDERAAEEKGAAFRSPAGYTHPYGGTGRGREERGELSRPASDPNGGRYDEKGELFDGRSTRSEQNFREAGNPNTASASSARANMHAASFPHLSSSSASSHQSYSSNSSFTEDAPKEPPQPAREVQDRPAPDPSSSPIADADVSEHELVIKLMDPELSEQESAVLTLRQATRESRSRRINLCTPRLLAALRAMLRVNSSAIQISATAALVNLSLEPENRVRIVRSGTVPPLVEVLKGGHAEARDHAAGALFSLALEEENRAPIGVLGAIPPLLDLFCVPTPDSERARRDAGMALYYLSLASSARSKIVQAPGAVRALLSVAAEREAVPPTQGPGLARLALMVVGNLAGSNEGRAALMDGGAVASIVSLMKSPASAAEEEYCVAALYGMSRGSLRFRGLARAAGAERVLMRVAEEGGGGELRREMTKKTLRAMRGEDDDESEESMPAMGFPLDGNSSVVSEGMMSHRRRAHHGNPAARMNSAEF